MAFAEFLEQFATAQGIASVDELLSKHADRYAFQIGSRDRAKRAIQLLEDKFDIDFKGKKVLDVGCAYGSLSIEIAKLGATVIGIDISDKWLMLGEVNARDEADVKLINCDASTFSATRQLADHGPFDVIIVNDVFEHIYDTAGLVANIAKLMASGGLVYFKVPNGLATRHVLLEGHKRTFGISLLAPDYWQAFVKAPFHIYYRRWDHFRGIFNLNGFKKIDLLNPNTDSDHDHTKRFILNDLNRIHKHLVPENFNDRTQLIYLRNAYKYYLEEVRNDLEELSWDDLHFKYRVNFWEGTLR